MVWLSWWVSMRRLAHRARQKAAHRRNTPGIRPSLATRWITP